MPSEAPSAFRASPPLFGLALYWLGYVFFRVLFTLWGRLRIAGQDRIPRTGPVIFAANHVSLLDPPLVGCCIPRMIHFMAKQELFDIPIFGWAIRQVNAFPIKRVERDVGAFKTAQRILNLGGALILFPEGRRQKTGILARAKPGVGMLAAKTRAQVVPVYVHNSHRFFSFKRLSVSFGEPLSPDRESDYQSFSDRVMEVIADLQKSSS